MAEVERPCNAARGGALLTQARLLAAPMLASRAVMPEHRHGGEQDKQQKQLHTPGPKIIGSPLAAAARKWKI